LDEKLTVLFIVTLHLITSHHHLFTPGHAVASLTFIISLSTVISASVSDQFTLRTHTHMFVRIFCELNMHDLNTVHQTHNEMHMCLAVLKTQIDTLQTLDSSINL
ncbi:hypothetical protein GX51_08219, partial [Blastomyces parvus]